MSKTARVYKIEMLIRERGHVSFQDMLDELEISRATLKRDLDYLRDQLGSPIEYDRDLNGYRFANTQQSRKHELPGLWFSEQELYSLLMAYQLLQQLDSGEVVSRHLKPLLDRIHQMLGPGDVDAESLLKRVAIVVPARRPVLSRYFELVGDALIHRRRLHVRYLTRSRGTVTDRELSPQRLIHYRNTWYLDAWCHLRDKLLRFALDAMGDVAPLERRAKDVPLKKVAAAMDAGYGIYAGAQSRWAKLVFKAQAAQWVSREEWHPKQTGRWLDGGAYELVVPYTDETEIAMDILRHGDQVQVLAPASLVAHVSQRLLAATAQYGSTLSASHG